MGSQFKDRVFQPQADNLDHFMNESLLLGIFFGFQYHFDLFFLVNSFYHSYDDSGRLNSIQFHQTIYKIVIILEEL